ncbi:hypothetical protein L6R50_06825 [Myxococcota bacterium]|nr:hypothetical protein [Myxococcota bacterium]
MTTPKIAVQYAFFCEIVRPEEHGKTTAIGLWGRVCRFLGPAPGVLSSLGFHAYLAHEGASCIVGRVRISTPGVDEPQPYEFKLVPREGSAGTNLNINSFGVLVTRPGFIRAELEIDEPCKVLQATELQVTFEDANIATAGS